ncbi:amino acid adenylation domain-containing protein [Tumebacillus sp. BK434]|uniref:non-ribosomal peptide synthetase/type I polyketide synthase n=1 Tax=Tumebacillus sp. BK434 TaxID=2512169 RepID=UPI0010ECC450|nr:non-ribosomal peptide synthetase/type I polyketide synthase [Tumebacillus sp. BK434]TCP55919.1 amino acid adenylation domain-containing protein [Tumebacillus sp. BK434]
MYQSLVEALRENAGTGAGVRFLNNSTNEEVLAYEALLAEAGQYLAAFQARGVEKGDELVLQFLAPRSFLTAYWACLLGGIVPIPLSYADNLVNTRKVFTVWEVLQSAWIVTDCDKLSAKLTAYAEEHDGAEQSAVMTARLFQPERVEVADRQPQFYEPGPEDIAFVQFSSGSTGQPKGVVLTHRNLLTNINDLVNIFEITENDRFLSWMPLTHDFGMIFFHLAPLVLGVEQNIMPTNTFIWNPTYWLSSVHKYRASVLGSPNFGYRHFLKRFKAKTAQAEAWDLSCVKVIINGAEPISAAICQDFADRLGAYGLSESTVRPGYGLAEATLVVSACKREQGVQSYAVDRRQVGIGQPVSFVERDAAEAMELVDCGHPVQHVEVRITDEQRQPLGEDIVGTIEIRGGSVTAGYHHNPEATAKVLSADGWLNTQDLGFLHEGRLVIVGRQKELILIGGANYFPHDIEKVILQGIGEEELNKYIACGVPNAETGTEDLVIFVYYKKQLDGFLPIVEQVRELVLSGVGLRVDHVLPVTAIPKTTSGKVQRFQLIQDFQSGKFASLMAQMPKDVADQQKTEGSELQKALAVNLSSTAVPAGGEYLTVVKGEVERLLGTAVDDVNTGFFDLGLSSMQLLILQERLEQRTGMALTSTAALDYPSIRVFAELLEQKQQAQVQPQGGQGKREEASGAVAVIGMACRFPGGSNTPDAYWQLLHESIDPVREIPSGRWQQDRAAKQKLTTSQGGYLDDIDQFDPLFFGISAKEAEMLDPQQRLLLELSWEALEDSGRDPKSLAGSQTGVFIGIAGSDYLQLGRDLGQLPGPYMFTGNMLNSAAGRLSYTFGFQGPCMAIDTACSSSLVAMHQGMMQLRSGACDLALAGAVNLILRAEAHASFSNLQALAESGRCRSFDEGADGYIRSEGSAVLVLKRLEDAERDGDPIWGVIRGGAVNHNGQSGGLTVPNGLAQQKVIRQALADAGLLPEQIDYVEGHGSGTKIGDPQEVNALAEVFAGRERPLYLGSVKSNLGHLETAAGMAGICKVLLAMRHGRLPANLHYRKGNPLIAWERLPVQVVDRTMAWEPRDGVYRAGISAFSISGTNAHLVLEARAERAERPVLTPRSAYLCTLSARTEASLRQYARELAAWCEQPTAGLAELSRTLNTGRAALPRRLSLVAGSHEELQKRLTGLLNGEEKLGADAATAGGRLVFLFTGQGSLYAEMAKELYEDSDVFRERLHALDAAFRPQIGVSLIDLLYGGGAEDLQRPLYSQPLIFSVQIALASFWASLGITPDLLIGHSIGEYAAACVDGVISLDDAVRMVAARAQVMDRTPAVGRMIGILAGVEKVQELIEGVADVSIAAVNSPDNVTVSGGKASIDELAMRARNARFFVQELAVSHPFHSVLMREQARQLADAISDVQFHAPSPRLISAVSGELAAAGKEIDADYWAGHLVEPVQFSAALQTAVQAGGRVFLEIGGTATLCGLAAQNFDREELAFLPSLRMGQPAWKPLLESAGKLWERGWNVRLGALDEGKPVRVDKLPHTPYDRKRVWFLETQLAPAVYQEVAAAAEPAALVLDEPMEQTGEHRANADLPSQLKGKIEEVTGVAAEEIAEAQSLFSLGIDSLMLVEISKFIQKQYGVEIALNTFFTELNTVEKVAAHLAEQGAVPFVSVAPAVRAVQTAPTAPAVREVPAPVAAADGVLEDIYRKLAHLESLILSLGAVQAETQQPKIGEVAERPASFELASDERRMYFMSFLAGGNEAHQIRGTFNLDGPVDVERLKRAFATVSTQHEMLRSSFRVEGAQVVHQIADAVEAEFFVADLRVDGEQERFDQFFRRPFDLATAPLWRWGVTVDPAGQHQFTLSIHHIIADGVSLNLLLNDISEVYQHGKMLGTPTLSYHEFVKREQQFLASPAAAEQEAWWRQHLQPLPQTLNFPSDAARPEINEFRGATCYFGFDSDVLAKVKEVAMRGESTTFMVLIAAWTAFLGRIAHQSDFCIGVPWNRRMIGDFARTVGMCTQTLVLRMQPERSRSFLSYLDAVKEVSLATYARSDYPLDLLLSGLNVERDMSRNPLFDVMFNYEKDGQRMLDFGDVRGVVGRFPVQHAQFDLYLDMFEHDDVLQCRLNYATPLFAAARVEDWAQRFQAFLVDVLQDPERPLGGFSLLRAEEERELLTQGRGPAVQGQPFARDLLDDSFRAHMDRPAVWYQGQELTFAALQARAEVLASHMIELGLEPGDRFGLLLPRSPDLVAAMLAGLQIGCAWVPLDTSFPQERLSYMVENSGAKLLIGDAALIEHSGYGLPALDPAVLETAVAGWQRPVQIAPDQLAYVIYTSGSTGRPKGVELEQCALANFLQGMAEALDWTPGARTACLTTPSFDIFLLETLLCLAQGGCIVLADDSDMANPASVLRLVQEGRVEALQVTPTRLRLLCADASIAHEILSGVSTLIVGGEAFPAQLLPLLQQHPSLRIFNVYGPTETCIWSTCKELTSAEDVTIGLPIRGTNVYVLDPFGEFAPPGMEGDLWIGGAGVARGYVANQALTGERFAADPFSGGRMYLTGDRARWKNGELECLGRGDDQIKLRGFRIELGELEEILRKHPAVTNAAATVRELSPGNQVLVSFYQRTPELTVTESELRAWLAERLPAYMVSEFLVELPAIPQTLNGKVNRQALPALPSASSALPTDVETEGGPLDGVLVNIWKKLLGDRPIGLHDSFFDLGGNSFSLVLLYAELDKEFPGLLTVPDLFALPTIAKLKAFLEAATGDSSLEGSGLLPLTGDWFETGSGERRLVETELEPEMQAKIAELGATYRLDFSETLLALYALYLQKSLGAEQIPLWLLGDAEQVARIDFRFAANMELAQVFSELSAGLPTLRDYQPLRKLNLTAKADGQVRAGFAADRGVDARRVLRKLDFYLLAEPHNGRVRLRFEYGNRLSGSALRNHLLRFKKLLKLVAGM